MILLLQNPQIDDVKAAQLSQCLGMLLGPSLWQLECGRRMIMNSSCHLHGLLGSCTEIKFAAISIYKHRHPTIASLSAYFIQSILWAYGLSALQSSRPCT